ncbi:MAG: hypothetical protein ACREGR_03280 [Minisyncoccia bacterium]
MAFIYREWRTLGASALAVVMIGGAFMLARGAGQPTLAEAASATALLAQISSRDSTGDGLPDWEKPLYGIPLDATTTDYFNLGMTDGEAVAKGLIVPKAPTPGAPAIATTTASLVDGVGPAAPGSLTAAFAQNFFALYVSAEEQNGGSLTTDQVNALASQALDTLASDVSPAPDFATAAQIKISGSGPDALKAYAAAAEQTFIAHEGAPVSESELQYLQDFLNGDSSALANLQVIATSYLDTATGLAAMSVPQEAAAPHLALVNALARMGENVEDFSHVDTDPLRAILALEQYPQSVLALTDAFNGIAAAFTAENVVLARGTPGAEFVNAMAIITANQATSTP